MCGPFIGKFGISTDNCVRSQHCFFSSNNSYFYTNGSRAPALWSSSKKKLITKVCNQSIKALDLIAALWLLFSSLGVPYCRGEAGDSRPAGCGGHGGLTGSRQTQHPHLRLPVLQLLQRTLCQWERRSLTCVVCPLYMELSNPLHIKWMLLLNPLYIIYIELS